MNITTEFRTDRFRISPIQLGDWPALLEAVSDAQFPTKLPLARIQTDAQARQWHACRVTEWEAGTGFVWSIRQKESTTVIGQVSILPRKSGYALAYWVSPTHWRTGVATEACSGLIRQLQRSGIDGQIWAGTQTWNKASSQVLVKLGFKCIGEAEHRLVNGKEEQICEFVRDIQQATEQHPSAGLSL